MLSQGNKVMTSEEIRKKWESVDRREKKAKYNQFYPHYNKSGGYAKKRWHLDKCKEKM